MGVLDINEKTFEINFGSRIGNFVMELDIGMGSKSNIYKVRQYQEEMSREIKQAILDLPMTNPTPKHIKKILLEKLGVVVKVKKTTDYGYGHFFVDWNLPGEKGMLWRTPQLHIPLPNGMELNSFRFNFWRKY